MTSVILDTNVFVGAAFNRRSASARIVETIQADGLKLVWSAATKSETQRILTRIPGISWEAVAGHFKDNQCFKGSINLAAVSFVEDPEDRKFAALSQATGATLISSDSDLLDHRDRLRVATPSEFIRSLDP